METPVQIGGMSELVHAIGKASQFFRDQAQRQVNTSLTLRNWIIGFYIVEYEQNGRDRAEYGEKLFHKLAEKIKTIGIRGLSFTVLHLCKQFYRIYPQILQATPAPFQLIENESNGILRAVTEELEGKKVHLTPAAELLSKLSFTHFVELIKVDNPIKRIFYETEAMVNNWSVRELQRAMDSMLFERTGLSKDKEAVLEKHRKGTGLTAEDVFRSPYMLDFLGLEEKPAYVETDLEGAIIAHLQSVPPGDGKGFLFRGEAEADHF